MSEQHGATWPFDAQRTAYEMATEFVDASDAGMDHLGRMLTVDVGHTEGEVVYAENKLELVHYEPEAVTQETPIFFVYSLINRPFIVDLQPDRSVLQRLLEAGFEVFVVEWGEPSVLDRSLDMRDYVCRYMHNCVDAICAESGVEDVHLLGYCMGGTMSIMYTAHDQERVRTLGLMATPIVFEDTGGILERWATHYDADTAVETFGNMPADLLTWEFTLMDPVQHYLTKYVHLYENLDDPEYVEKFARMEKWSFDGVDVAGEAYREFINDIYKDNLLIKSEYELDGEPVELEDIEVPVLQIVGEYDHLVPPASSKPFNDAIGSDDERIIEFPTGHIGMSISSHAQETLWPEVADWFAERDGPATTDEAEADAPATEAVDPAVAAAQVEEVSEQVRASPDGGATTGHDTPVESVTGIGPTYAERLAAAGIETVAELRETPPEELAAVTEAPQGRAEGWLDHIA